MRQLSTRFAAGLVVIAIGAFIAGIMAPGNVTDVFPPDWTVNAAQPITTAFRVLTRETTLFGYEIGEITRGIAGIVAIPLRFVQNLFVHGLPIGFGSDPVLTVPPLPWLGLVIVSSLAAFTIGGAGLATLVGGSLVYMAVFGLWMSAMMTIASVLVAVSAGTLLGLAIGIAAYRSPAVERVMDPVCDGLQTLPIFSFLLPLVVFLGIGPTTALVATVLFAAPPLARVVVSTLRSAPRGPAMFARMAGLSETAAILRVELPSQRDNILIGVNQVIMLSLSMVVIASLVGAGGLGADVLRGLRTLRFGEALAAGIAITLIAVSFDRVMIALVRRRPDPGGHKRFQSLITIGCAALAATWILGPWWPALSTFPEQWTLATGQTLTNAVQWLNRTYGQEFNSFRDAITLGLMRPVRDFLLDLPWLSLTAVAAAAGVATRGLKSGLLIGLAMASLAVLGLWEPAMRSLYLVSIATFLACIVGLPIGMLAASYPRIGAVTAVAIDVLQTLPSFVYLIPFVVLFSVGETPALFAITLYALPAVIRYTRRGLEGIDASVIEAVRMSGASPWYSLFAVRLPIAAPMIMLGVSQTIVLAFSMLVVTALIGSRGLEIVTLEALGRVDIGRGLIAGLGIVVLTIVADRLMRGLASKLAAGRPVEGAKPSLRHA